MTKGYLAKKIKRHYKGHSDLLEVLVYADSKQVGKSSYVLQTMHQVYEDWDEVFDRLFFEPVEFVKFTKMKMENGEKIKSLCWDDAGVHAGSDLYFRDRDLYWDLGKIIQLMGTITQSFFVTTPSPDTPTGMLVDDKNVIVKITKQGQGTTERTAKIFAESTLPWGKGVDTKIAETSFDVMLPDEVHERYKVLRNDLASQSVGGFLDRVKDQPDY